MNAAICSDTGHSKYYIHLIEVTYKPKWTKSMYNKLGQIFQDIGDVDETDTCFLYITYCRILCETRPHKKETHILIITICGNKITNEGLFSTPTADLVTAKIDWKIIISTPYYRYLIVEVKKVYLNNTMNNK